MGPFGGVSYPKRQEVGVKLTEKQMAVMLAYINTGTIDGAAEETGISASTVRGHLRAVQTKLGADGARDLLAAALRHDLIRLEVVGP